MDKIHIWSEINHSYINLMRLLTMRNDNNEAMHLLRQGYLKIYLLNSYEKGGQNILRLRLIDILLAALNPNGFQYRNHEHSSSCFNADSGHSDELRQREREWRYFRSFRPSWR